MGQEKQPQEKKSKGNGQVPLAKTLAGTMGFEKEKGVSVDMPPTHPICQKCRKCFSPPDACHPRLIMTQIKQATAIMVELERIQVDDKVKCGNNLYAPMTCFVHCKALTKPQRAMFAQSITYRATIKETTPPTPIRIILAERDRSKDRSRPSVNEKVLSDVVKGGAYGIGSDLND
ncbi:TPA: hypothetical protein DIV45_02675 [Patescibacteria group bacterium]|uniref:Uncharacterized protein n=1 Tax=candidate division Kazan bacterium GW2011_GWA1_44_22 TaxID=1620410 RepID=A0A0G1KXB1_UNCK3|nr:MAG: hypothetical protein VE96_C0015G0002 [candidate division Kazan bacterium GW2011_GWA1_44_22]HCR42239.1 hypothetical protein [Patescibacteria group bacterium]